MSRYFKIEGNILYPDKQILTWGPFYFHSFDNAKERMEVVLKDIVNWVNLQDPTLQIEPENLYRTKNGEQIIFDIKAWKDDIHLEECAGIITVEEIFFEDEKAMEE